MIDRNDEFRRLVEIAAALAAAVVMQRGELTDDELRAMPMIRSTAMADAVRSRLLRKYNMRIASDASLHGHVELRPRFVVSG